MLQVYSTLHTAELMYLSGYTGTSQYNEG